MIQEFRYVVGDKYCFMCTYTSIIHLDDTQTSLATAQERERIASEYAQELNARVTSLEAQLSNYRQEKARLAAELEMNQTKLEAAEEAKTKYLQYSF